MPVHISIFVHLFAAALLTAFANYAVHKNITGKAVSLRILESIYSFIIFISIFLLSGKNNLIAFALVFTAVTVFNIYKIYDVRIKLKSGLILIPLVFLLMIVITPAKNLFIISLTSYVLSVAVLLATFLEGRIKSKEFNLTGDSKSLVGTVTFFISIIILTYSFIRLAGEKLNFGFTENPNSIFALAVIEISLVITILEIFLSKYFRYLLLTIFSFILYYIFLTNFSNEFIINFAAGILLGIVIVLPSLKFKFLTRNGAAATFLIAVFLFGLGGLKWSVPIIAFFILSSLLSKIRHNKNSGIDLYFEKTGKRDYLQVLSNGGIGGVLVIVNHFEPNQIFYWFYLASIAAVCADTWGTEIGTLIKTNTYNILNLKRVDQGISGGISFPGTLGAITGAFIIGLSGLYWINSNQILLLVLISFSGIAGSFIDSILGASVQSQYKCKICGNITERKIHCNKETEKFRGVNWISNDVVNFLCGISSVIIIFILKLTIL